MNLAYKIAIVTGAASGLGFATARTLAKAGARVAGVAKMDQLAYSLVGNVGEGVPPVNRFAPDCFCGGSSSGSASAVAGGLADLGLGTDTAGSIRVPAAACGLYSIRTTHGLVSKDGVIPLAKSLDAVGLLARSPELLSKAMTATSDRDTGRAAVRRVLLPTDLRRDYAPATWSALKALAETLAAITGAAVQEIRVSRFVNATVADLFARIECREIWAEHAQWISSNFGYFAHEVETRLRRCESLSKDPREVIDADLAAREKYKREVDELLEDGSVLLMPVVPERGPLRAWADHELLAYRVACFRLTAPSSLAGVPQVVLPTAAEAGYVPLGLLAQAKSDRFVLDLVADLAKGDASVAL